jgi:hypothetical protein
MGCKNELQGTGASALDSELHWTICGCVPGAARGTCKLFKTASEVCKIPIYKSQYYMTPGSTNLPPGCLPLTRLPIF